MKAQLNHGNCQINYWSRHDDGVPNGNDICAMTPVSAVVGPSTGCSIGELCPCEGPMGTTTEWMNHGKYVSCVAKSSEGFVEMELISELEKDLIVSEAAQSDCGEKKQGRRI